MDNDSFLSLTPSNPIDTAPVMFEPQPVLKSPLLAFLLSLAFPGAGEIYCGKTSRALWTFAIFLPALAPTVYLTLQLGSEGREVGRAHQANVCVHLLQLFYCGISIRAKR